MTSCLPASEKQLFEVLRGEVQLRKYHIKLAFYSTINLTPVFSHSFIGPAISVLVASARNA